MRDALRAEWTKLCTLASIYWLLLTAAALTVGLSAALVAGSSYQLVGYQDMPKLSLTGIDLGQAIVAVLAILVISNEYSTGMIGITLTAMPRRLLVLGAKATTLTGLIVVVGVIAVGGSLLAGRLILPGNGFTVAHGYSLLSLGSRIDAPRCGRVGSLPCPHRTAQSGRRHRHPRHRRIDRSRARAPLPVPTSRAGRKRSGMA